MIHSTMIHSMCIKYTRVGNKTAGTGNMTDGNRATAIPLALDGGEFTNVYDDVYNWV